MWSLWIKITGILLVIAQDSQVYGKERVVIEGGRTTVYVSQRGVLSLDCVVQGRPKESVTNVDKVLWEYLRSGQTTWITLTREEKAESNDIAAVGVTRIANKYTLTLRPILKDAGTYRCRLDSESNPSKDTRTVAVLLPDMTCEGDHYNGTQSTSASGKSCLAWETMKSGFESDLIRRNYEKESGLFSYSNNCRNPDRSKEGPWCYVQNGATTVRETCDVKRCPPIDGEWSEWIGQSCAVTCGDGTNKQYRIRLCSEPKPSYGGKYCEGMAWKMENCQDIKPCRPADGGWRFVGEWSDCSATCGEGVIRRSRECTNPEPQNGGKDCEGPNYVTTYCNRRFCHGSLEIEDNDNTGVDEEFQAGESVARTCIVKNKPEDYQAQWVFSPEGIPGEKVIQTFGKPKTKDMLNDWRVKTSTVIKGNVIRSTLQITNLAAVHDGTYRCQLWPEDYVLLKFDRLRQIDHTYNLDQDVHFLYDSFRFRVTVDGGWTEWTSWTKCSSCNKRKFRKRYCTNPKRNAHGRDCPGMPVQIISCSQNCNGEWSMWSSKTTCNATCGGGVQYKERECVPQPGTKFHRCLGDSRSRPLPCNVHLCPELKIVSNKSVRARVGDTVRLVCVVKNRPPRNKLTGRKPKLYWQHIGVRDGDIRDIGKDGESFASRHNVIADDKEETYTVEIVKVAREDEGNYSCWIQVAMYKFLAEKVDFQVTVDGGWGEFGAWSTCRCQKIQKRTRKCNSPTPIHGGLPCRGLDTETRNCSGPRCPAVDHWSEWSSWTQCSFTCAASFMSPLGIHMRHRTCTKEDAVCETYYGKYLFQSRFCNLQICPGKNLARGRISLQSSRVSGGYPQRAVDGRRDNDYNLRSCTHTSQEDKPWWRVQLTEPNKVVAVHSVMITNRLRAGERLRNFKVLGLRNFKESLCFHYRGQFPGAETLILPCNAPKDPEKKRKEFHVKDLIIRLEDPGILTLCEVEVFGEDPGCFDPTTGKFTAFTRTICALNDCVWLRTKAYVRQHCTNPGGYSFFHPDQCRIIECPRRDVEFTFTSWSSWGQCERTAGYLYQSRHKYSVSSRYYSGDDPLALGSAGVYAPTMYNDQKVCETTDATMDSSTLVSGDGTATFTCKFGYPYKGSPVIYWFARKASEFPNKFFPVATTGGESGDDEVLPFYRSYVSWRVREVAIEFHEGYPKKGTSRMVVDYLTYRDQHLQLGCASWDRKTREPTEAKAWTRLHFSGLPRIIGVAGYPKHPLFKGNEKPQAGFVASRRFYTFECKAVVSGDEKFSLEFHRLYRRPLEGEEVIKSRPVISKLEATFSIRVTVFIHDSFEASRIRCAVLDTGSHIVTSETTGFLTILWPTDREYVDLLGNVDGLLGVQLALKDRTCITDEKGVNFEGTHIANYHDDCAPWNTKTKFFSATVRSAYDKWSSAEKQSTDCRNPDNSKAPWCYIRLSYDPSKWRYCDIARCPAELTQCGTTSAPCPDPEPDGNCLSDEQGLMFTGKMSKTESGKQCVVWKSVYLNEVNTGTSDWIKEYEKWDEEVQLSSWCRNPDRDSEGPWCMSLGGVKEYCDIPTCPRVGDNTNIGLVVSRGQTVWEHNRLLLLSSLMLSVDGAWKHVPLIG